MHVVDRGNDGVVLRGAKLHITGVSLGHDLMTIPTKSMKDGEGEYAIGCAVPDVGLAGTFALALGVWERMAGIAFMADSFELWWDRHGRAHTLERPRDLNAIDVASDVPLYHGPNAWDVGRTMAAALMALEDAREGAKAFIEKRAPRWVGQCAIR